MWQPMTIARKTTAHAEPSTRQPIGTSLVAQMIMPAMMEIQTRTGALQDLGHIFQTFERLTSFLVAPHVTIKRNESVRIDRKSRLASPLKRNLWVRRELQSRDDDGRLTHKKSIRVWLMRKPLKHALLAEPVIKEGRADFIAVEEDDGDGQPDLQRVCVEVAERELEA